METTAPQTKNLLESFEQKAISAHNFTSFSPELRGRQMIKEYGEELSEDINHLKSQSIDDSIIEEYVTRYKRFFSSYLGAKSNCFSVMITGASGINVRKHEKANRSERRHYEVFREWRERAKKAIIRKSKPAKTFSSEIERYKSELESLKKNHELMKEGNKRIKQALKNKVNIDSYLIETFGIQQHMLEWTYKFGFGLANNNANIKRVEQRIKELEGKEEKANLTGSESLRYKTFELVYNYEIDRVQIKHDSKPNQEVINNLKSSGFKWSPSGLCWQRQLTDNARWTLKHKLLPKLIELES